MIAGGPEPKAASTAVCAHSWHWEVASGVAAVCRLAERWNQLAHGSSLSPVADALWMDAFWGAFASRDQDLVVHSLHSGGRLLAVLPLRRRGSLAPAWCSPRNPEWPYWMFCLDEQETGIGEAIGEHLFEDACVLDFWPIHAAGPIRRAIAGAAAAREWTLVEMPRGGDTLIELAGPWDQFCKALPADLQQKTITRKLRQLERQGAGFECLRSGPELSAALEECYRIESRGWKGRRGAPICSDPRTDAFYRRLAAAESAAGRFALYVLRIGRRIIAFEYCLRAQGKIDLLKLSFDSDYAHSSPGQVLRWLLLRHELELGEIHSYHMGRASAWKAQWATRVDPLIRLRAYRPGLRGRLSCWSGPYLRARVKRLPLAGACYRRLVSHH